MTTTLLLADDHQMIRSGLSASLERRGQFNVIAQAATGAEAIAQTIICKPDVVILDVRLPDIDGFVVCREIKAQLPETAVLLIATHDWDVDLAQSYYSGAAGFLAKELSLQSLICAIEEVAKGQFVYTPSQKKRIQQWEHNVNGLLATLTRREEDVFQAIVQSQTNLEISKKLHISVRTVETHVSHILRKLNLSSRRELRQWAVDNHLVTRHK